MQICRRISWVVLLTWGVATAGACGPAGSDDDTTPSGDDDTIQAPSPTSTPWEETPTPRQVTPTPFPDLDQDGFGADLDCDDGDASINPGALEVCDGTDNDCDGLTDDFDPDVASDSSGEIPAWYMDRDGDGYGDAESVSYRCNMPPGHVAVSGDCNDNDPAFHPDAPEEDCTNPNDYNCDGTTLYADGDLDGFPACVECNDQDATINPDATETCDHIDNDCDGLVDDDDIDVQGRTAWYLDADGDGYGTDNSETIACFAPTDQYVTTRGDCNDGDSSIRPGGEPGCDDRDHDCDGAVDNDGDGDGFSDPTCGGGDCDDSDPSARPDDGSCALELVVVIGDNDGFGFGIADGADLNSSSEFASLEFDNRTETDPEFTDFGDKLLEVGPLSWSFAFDVGYREISGVTLMIDMAGIQDAVPGSCEHVDDELWVDGIEVPGAFDGMNLGTYGTALITFDLATIVPEILPSAADGMLEFTFDLDRTQTLPDFCVEYFSIDFTSLTIFADRTAD